MIDLLDQFGGQKSKSILVSIALEGRDESILDAMERVRAFIFEFTSSTKEQLEAKSWKIISERIKLESNGTFSRVVMLHRFESIPFAKSSPSLHRLAKNRALTSNRAILKLVSFLIIGFALIIDRPIQSYGNRMKREAHYNISFTGNPEKKAQAIKAVDCSLRLHGDLGSYGNLTGGLQKIMKEGNIEIIDMPGKYQVIMAPKSDQGHDFSFLVDKESGLISDLVVGEIMPAPQ